LTLPERHPLQQGCASRWCFTVSLNTRGPYAVTGIHLGNTCNAAIAHMVQDLDQEV
jgi:hypothetical protein